MSSHKLLVTFTVFVMLQRVEAIEQCYLSGINSWECNYSLISIVNFTMFVRLYVTLAFRNIIGGQIILPMNYTSFFMPYFHRIHESYGTVFFVLALYSSHEVLKRNHVHLVAKAFIFATLAARDKDYEIIDGQKPLTVSACYSQFIRSFS